MRGNASDTMKDRTKIAITVTIAIGLFFFFSFFTFSFTFPAPKAKAVKLNCSEFASQATAQRAFISDPVYYSSLDSDKDGIACESLLKK